MLFAIIRSERFHENRPGYWGSVIREDYSGEIIVFCPGCGAPLSLRGREILASGRVRTPVPCTCGFCETLYLMGWFKPS